MTARSEGPRTAMAIAALLVAALAVTLADSRPIAIAALLVGLTVYFQLFSRTRLNGNSLVTPAVALIVAIVLLPLLGALALSLLNITGANLRVGPWRFVAFENYSSIATNPTDTAAATRTLILVVVTVSLQIAGGVLWGLLLASRERSSLHYALLFLPVTIPPLIAGMIWRSVFDFGFGLANRIAMALGGDPIAWLALPSDVAGGALFPPAMGAVVAVEVWQWTPFVALVVAAAIRQTPDALSDWSATQGASPVRLARHVWAPQLMPILTMLMALRLVDTFKVYESVWSLFGSNVTTATLSVRIGAYAFEARAFSLASALAVVFCLMVSAIAATLWASSRGAFHRSQEPA